MNSTTDESDSGAPLPDFRTQGLQLQTIAPALGVINQKASPDYLDYDAKGRGIFSTMFANSGMAYLLGISAGGVYGFRQGLAATPSTRFRVQVNSVLNHSGRYGSRAGNALGVFAVLYSFYEGVSDRYEPEELLGLTRQYPSLAAFISPVFGATMASATYYAPSGLRVATLAGGIGGASVAVTYGCYKMLGVPYGKLGFLFF